MLVQSNCTANPKALFGTKMDRRGEMPVKFLLLISMLGSAFSKIAQINVNVVVLLSEDGNLAFITDTVTILPYWEHHLKLKLQLDPTWPLNVTVEKYNVHSDPHQTETILRKRLTNKNLPNVTAIIGPETNLLGYIAGGIAAEYGIPCIMSVTSPDPLVPGRPSYLSTSFLIEPAAMYQFRELINEYEVNKVSSMVAVSFYEPDDSYNDDTCFGTAKLASTRGIKVLNQLSIQSNNTSDDVYNLIVTIRDHYNPDAIIWCDWASCALPDNIMKYNPLPAFAKANYLPKALSLLDCIDQPGVKTLYDEGLFQYVSAGQYINEKLRGSDYTEDATPYSSVFRPTTQKNFTVY